MPPRKRKHSRKLTRFPPEVVGFVLEKLRPQQPISTYPRLPRVDFTNDNADLSSCSLVCKQWRELSRRHLFHSITFTFGPEVDDEDMKDGTTRLKTLDELVNFVAQHRDSTQYITYLSLVVAPDPYGRLRHAKRPSPSVLMALFLAISPSRRLRGLYMHGVILDRSESTRYRQMWTKCLPPLDTLHVSYRDDDLSSGDVFGLLAMFTTTRVLKLNASEIHDSISIMPSHLEVEEIELFNTLHSRMILPPITHQPTMGNSLRLLVIKSFGDYVITDEEDINMVLKELGSTLKEFHCDIYVEGLDEAEFMDLQFSPCIALRTLALTFRVFQISRGRIDIKMNELTWDGLADIFAHSPPPNLERLDLFLDQGQTVPHRFHHFPPSITAFETAITQLTSLRTINVYPCFARRLALAMQFNPEQMARIDSALLHSWLDPQLPIMLFAGLLLDQKLSNPRQRLWIGGDNSLYDAIMSDSAERRKHDQEWDMFYRKFETEGTRRKNLR